MPRRSESPQRNAVGATLAVAHCGKTVPPVGAAHLGRPHLIRHGLWPCHLPLKGKAGDTHFQKPSPLGADSPCQGEMAEGQRG